MKSVNLGKHLLHLTFWCRQRQKEEGKRRCHSGVLIFPGAWERDAFFHLARLPSEAVPGDPTAIHPAILKPAWCLVLSVGDRYWQGSMLRGGHPIALESHTAVALSKIMTTASRGLKTRWAQIQDHRTAALLSAPKHSTRSDILMSPSFISLNCSREILEQTSQMPVFKPAVAQSSGLHVKTINDIFGKIPRNWHQVYFKRDGTWGQSIGKDLSSIQMLSFLTFESTACNN